MYMSCMLTFRLEFSGSGELRRGRVGSVVTCLLKLSIISRIVSRISTIFYFTTIIIFNFVLCFRPLSVSSPAPNVTAIGTMGAN